MPNPCEYVEEFAEATNRVAVALDVQYRSSGVGVETPANEEFGEELGASGVASETVVLSKSYNVNEATAHATASPSVSAHYDDALESAARGTESAVLSTTSALTEAANAVSSAAYGVDTNVVSGAVASSSALLAPVRADEFDEAANAVATLRLERTLALVTSGNATAAVKIEITARVVESANATGTAAAGAHLSLDLESSAFAAESTAAQRALLVKAESRAVANSDALPVDSAAPAFWTNSESFAAATWTQVPFESYAMFDGVLLAAGADGIYAFGANDDDGAQIPVRVVSDRLDFGDQRKKRFDVAYASGVLSGPLRLTVETEQGSFEYDSHLPSSSIPTNHRFPLGRGLSGAYARFTLTNPSGVRFDLKELQIVTGVSTRRIGG